MRADFREILEATDNAVDTLLLSAMLQTRLCLCDVKSRSACRALHLLMCIENALLLH
jgi:hypothetical protein